MKKSNLEMEETLSCGKKPTWKWKKPYRNITDNPKCRLSPKQDGGKKPNQPRHDFCSPLQVKPNTERRCHGITTSRNDQLWLEWKKNYICIFHMLRPFIGFTYIPGGGNSRSFLFPPRSLSKMIQLDFCIFFQMGGSTSNWRSTIKRSVTTHLKVTTKKCEASCRFWKTLKWFSGFSFCDLFHLYTFAILFLHCNVSPKKSSIPQHLQFPILLRVRKSLGGKRWRFIFKGF